MKTFDTFEEIFVGNKTHVYGVTYPCFTKVNVKHN
jgi:hypothetical protein